MTDLVSRFAYKLDCRRTRRGADTTLRVHGQEPIVYNRSKSGNHWSEQLHVWLHQYVYIRDISNTGRHHCRVVQVQPNDDGEFDFVTVAAANADAPWECPVCRGEV